MKALIFGLLLASTGAFATDTSPTQPTAPTSICDQFMTCGTFEGIFESDAATATVTRIEISAIGQTQARLVYTTLIPNEEPQSLDLEGTFEADGSFKFTAEGRTYVNGICRNLICTYAMGSWTLDDGSLRAHTGVFAFTATGLDYRMSWGLPSDWNSDFMRMVKK